jgi:hemerythrin superfamily protein
MPNGIDLILADHRYVAGLFEAFEKTGDATIIGQIIDALNAHDAAEHGALYPLVGNVLGDPDLIERSAVAHSAVKKQIYNLTTQEGQHLTDACDQLRALVEAHVEDEEKNILPALADKATPQQLDGLGARILQAKQRGG